ncbi:hypothetical protein MAP00_000081 [Monascus purpureus]|nr:hypothetical protein MAP00_000081 [Monascus purpureus]
MDLLRPIIDCLMGHANESPSSHHDDKRIAYRSQPRAAQEIAADVLSWTGITRKRLDETVGEYGWTEEIGKAVLHGLEQAIRARAKMTDAVNQAVQTATEAAVGFAKEHPVYCTLIALGVLAILTPWVIEALGFGELGPIEGSFAAFWQRMYAGYVPKNSLFSYFQRLGMIWKH